MYNMSMSRSNTGKTDIDELNMSIESLGNKIEELHIETNTYLDNRYVQFKVQPNKNHNMEVKLQVLLEKMKQLNFNFKSETEPELQNSTGELKCLFTIQEMNIKLQNIEDLINIDQMLRLAQQELHSHHYFKAAQILQDLHYKVKYINDFDNPNILIALKKEAVVLGESFLDTANNIWRDSIICESEQKKQNIQLKINNQSNFKELLQALCIYNELNLKLKLFSEGLMENVMLVLMQKQCAVSVEDSDCLMISVEGQDKDTLVNVISNIEKIFSFLSKVFDMTINPSDGNGRTTSINLLGKLMAKNFCDLFIKEVIQPAIPCTIEDRAAYDVVLEHTTKLQNYLQSIGFLNRKDQSLLDYRSVDEQVIIKYCQMNMSEARSIMKKDLQGSIEINPQISLSWTNESTRVTDVLENWNCPSLSTNVLAFPKCLISKSLEELILLLQKLFKECFSNNLIAKPLYSTARKVIDMYCAITPVYHKKCIDTLPQQAALLHNNCMYLAYQLQLLDAEFYQKRCSDKSFQFLILVDLICKLRQTGSKAFLEQMQVQKEKFERLKDSGLSNLGKGGHLADSNKKKIIESCEQYLQQLDLLQREWKSILPSNVYNKAIGTLLNMLVEELVLRVSKPDDMAAETATHLVSVFTTVVDRAPNFLMVSQGRIDPGAKGGGAVPYAAIFNSGGQLEGVVTPPMCFLSSRVPDRPHTH